MAPERSLTPEKQLLRLIEESKSKPSPPKLEAQAIKYHSQSFFSFGAWAGRFSFLKGKFKGSSRAEGSSFDAVKLINIALGAAILALAFYLVSSFLLSLSSRKKLPEAVPAVTDIKKDQPPVVSSLQPPAFYLEKVNQRNIFKIGAKKVAADQGASDQSKIQEFTKSLKLVGISWSSDPDAMIEDTKAARTFFIKKDQKIGELTVKEIAKDKVILTYEGEDVELR